MSHADIAFFTELEEIIHTRLRHPTNDSYTARLHAAGTKRLAQKVGEEGLEVALAATAGDKQEVVDEAADLVYHLVVLLADQGLRLGDVADRLKARHAAKPG
ncbi:MAG: phosphoribosyl-ATP diphosphatase [Gammaproteobacteria bacterium]|nr:phosphoribosyl-ATP diphosphatase [Gammaproteobacteria bacterium]